MPPRNVSQSHVLPSSPTWIEFPRTDGNAGQWASLNTQCVIDHEGHVNFYRPTTLDESVSVKWRVEVGNALAVRMNMPEGPSYALKDWPEGYHMFDHNKGPQGAPRHDMYLIGSLNVNRFRSVPEFIPHALWLMTDETMDRSNCLCKYCTKTPQRKITFELGLSQRSSSVDTATATARIQKIRERRSASNLPKPYAAVRRVPAPAKPPVLPKQVMLRERNGDLRAAVSKSHLKSRRLYRDGEILWCALSPPIRRRMEEENSIIFWPAVVQEIKFKSEAIPRPHSTAADITMNPVNKQTHDLTFLRGPDNGDPTPWDIRHSDIYKMKLLAVSMSMSVSDDQVLPYHAYQPAAELLQAIRDVPLEMTNPHPERIASFNPCPAPPSPSSSRDHSEHDNRDRFTEAAAPYSLAIQIAASLAGYWSLTDEWECKYPVTLKAPKSRSSSSILHTHSPQTLQEAIQASMSNNAALNDGSQSISVGPSRLSGVSSYANHGTQISDQPTAATHTVTETRYQGLWWGPERIWVDELIRLKIARRQIDHKHKNVYAPSGPSQSTKKYLQKLAAAQDQVSPDLDKQGAGEKGVFMRLDGLFLVDVPNADGSGTSKEARASGMLYELADKDWEDPMEIQMGDGKNSISSSAKGKATVTLEVSQTEASPSFMPGPSPLKPPPLPNPDPSVPVGSTSAATSAAMLPDSRSPNAQQPSLTTQLSRPAAADHYSLPNAPKGYKFRPILPLGYEAVMSLTVIAGRYYPGLLAHPLFQPRLHEVATACEGSEQDDPLLASTDSSKLQRYMDATARHMHIWALEGLVPGYHNEINPVKWKNGRLTMTRDADKEARSALEAHWEQMRSIKEQQMDMEVDDIGEPS